MGLPLPPGARITVVADDGRRRVVVARLHSLRPDLDLLDRMARLQLAAARLGIGVGYAEPCPTLRRVIELSGLDEVLLSDPSVEPRRQTEGREVLGADEVGPRRDPSP
ncbi:hypothetical protein [Actinomarinicola tropica]|uniref:STAS domain-containing protein n=1 Tax=Actinomarinicola tropica TaxID=2789776 RepID=A0A5Q2RKQ7_9ACTN|nr:hypothetical protein [Actinomarinicola tropica]QGG96413.1 hypothetical protein GH723_15620 [Actinomarinicola tropica]